MGLTAQQMEHIVQAMRTYRTGAPVTAMDVMMAARLDGLDDVVALGPVRIGQYLSEICVSDCDGSHGPTCWREAR